MVGVSNGYDNNAIYYMSVFFGAQLLTYDIWECNSKNYNRTMIQQSCACD